MFLKPNYPVIFVLGDGPVSTLTLKGQDHFQCSKLKVQQDDSIQFSQLSSPLAGGRIFSG